MKDRIKQLRKHLKLNQTEFGEKIGVKQTTVAGYENGTREPLDAVINSICRQFSVSPEWLRTGEGEMLRQQTRYEQIASFFGDLMNSEPDVRHRFISAIEKTDIETLKMIEQAALRLVEEMQKTDP